MIYQRKEKEIIEKSSLASYALKSYQIGPSGKLSDPYPLDAATLKKREKIMAAAEAKD